jgi:hypothetical protein
MYFDATTALTEIGEFLKRVDFVPMHTDPIVYANIDQRKRYHKYNDELQCYQNAGTVNDAFRAAERSEHVGFWVEATNQSIIDRQKSQEIVVYNASVVIFDRINRKITLFDPIQTKQAAIRINQISGGVIKQVLKALVNVRKNLRIQMCFANQTEDEFTSQEHCRRFLIDEGYRAECFGNGFLEITK